MTDTHIKIKPVTPKVQYVGNGSTTIFAYSFPIFDDSDMEIYFGDEKQTTGYTISGAGQTDGGNVTFSTAPMDGTVITLVRNVPIERLTDFQEGGTFRAKNINDELDRQTAFVQQVSAQLSRCVQVGVTSDVDPSAILPEVERLYDSVDNIDALAEDKDNMNAVAADLTNIDIVAGNKTNIDSVADNKTNIDTVALDTTNINTIATNISNVNAVGTNISNVNTVAENISEITDKANKDMNNLTTTGKEAIVGLCVPDYSAGSSVTLPFTATTDGVLKVNTNGYCYLYINGADLKYGINVIASSGGDQTSDFILPKGTAITSRSLSGTNTITFYPMKGVE